MPHAIVLRAPGTNCEQEMLRAFRLAGAEVSLVHLDAVIADPALLADFDIFGFPGGFSYGDDIASGRVFAMKLREKLLPALLAARDRRCPMIGACNGFQVLVQVGLLPGPMHASEPVSQTVALTDNQDGRFRDRWVGVEYVRESVCVWTRGLAEMCEQLGPSDASQLPVAHGEGRFVAADEGVLDALERHRQIVLRYKDNSNGSDRAIAGICDVTGLLFGLMPHPERFLEWNKHPWWTRLDAGTKAGRTPGLAIFENAVRFVLERDSAGRSIARGTVRA